MKLSYRILWLDDVINEFIDDEIVEEVEQHLVNKGFTPDVVTVDNVEDFFSRLDDNYDLILTDYHLNEINGDKVIERIRGQHYDIMTEILFYTARADLKDTQKISRVSFLETNGLLGNHREEVQKAVINLINLTVKKFDDVVSMRGMIMHETSALDVAISEVLIKVLKKGDTETMLSTIKKKALKSNADFFKRIESCDDLEDLLLYIGADHRIRGLIRNTPNGEIKDVLSQYSAEVIQVRNQFAHAVLDTERKVFITRKGIEFHEETCKKIRSNISKHKINIEKYNSSLEE